MPRSTPGATRRCQPGGRLMGEQGAVLAQPDGGMARTSAFEVPATTGTSIVERTVLLAAPGCQALERGDAAARPRAGAGCRGSRRLLSPGTALAQTADHPPARTQAVPVPQ